MRMVDQDEGIEVAMARSKSEKQKEKEVSANEDAINVSSTQKTAAADADNKMSRAPSVPPLINDFNKEIEDRNECCVERTDSDSDSKSTSSSTTIPAGDGDDSLFSDNGVKLQVDEMDQIEQVLTKNDVPLCLETDFVNKTVAVNNSQPPLFVVDESASTDDFFDDAASLDKYKCPGSAEVRRPKPVKVGRVRTAPVKGMFRTTSDIKSSSPMFGQIDVGDENATGNDGSIVMTTLVDRSAMLREIHGPTPSLSKNDLKKQGVNPKLSSLGKTLFKSFFSDKKKKKAVNDDDLISVTRSETFRVHIQDKKSQLEHSKIECIREASINSTKSDSKNTDDLEEPSPPVTTSYSNDKSDVFLADAESKECDSVVSTQDKQQPKEPSDVVDGDVVLADAESKECDSVVSTQDKQQPKELSDVVDGDAVLAEAESQESDSVVSTQDKQQPKEPSDLVPDELLQPEALVSAS